MNIALCISGQPRNVYRGIENILQNLKFDFDVFSHAWWNNNSNGTTFGEASELVKNDWITKMYENFNIKKILIEEQKYFDVPEIFEKRKLKFTHTFGACSSQCSVYKCNQLKKKYESKKNFKYDYVIRTRYDFGLSIPINIDGFDNNFIYAPNDNSHRYGFNDQFAIGSSENMDIYSEVFPNIENILKSHNTGIYTAHYCDKPDNMGAEQMVQRHLENNNIKFKLLDFKNFLFRDEGKRSRIHSIEG